MNYEKVEILSVEDISNLYKINEENYDNIDDVDIVNLDKYTESILRKAKKEINSLIQERINLAGYNKDDNPLTVDATKNIFKDVYRVAISNKNRIVLSLANYTYKEINESDAISNVTTYEENKNRIDEIEESIKRIKKSEGGLDELEKRLSELKRLENY